MECTNDYSEAILLCAIIIKRFFLSFEDIYIIKEKKREKKKKKNEKNKKNNSFSYAWHSMG